MDGLRWVLLLFGALVIVGVFLYSLKDRKKPVKISTEPKDQDAAPSVDRREPSFGENLDSSGDAEDLNDATSGKQQKIVTLRIVAGDKTRFAGDELVLSLRGIGMRHGQFGIFHRLDGNDDGRVIFSAASLVEPGSFDLENIKEQKIPGISLFMVLPGPIDGAEAFDLMMVASRTLTQSLSAELLDETGSTLSIQRERYLREEIIRFQHGILVA